MAAVSKSFDTNGESKEIVLGKKIAELKKRLVLAGKFTLFDIERHKKFTQFI